MQEEPFSVLKRIVFWLVFLGVSTVVLIAATEGIGRFVVYLRYGVPGKTYGLWKYDPELGAIHASEAYNSNSETDNYGFRNREDVNDLKPKGAWRIIAYGGSTTFCYNLPTDEAWPLQLQTLLRFSGNPKDQVLNAGAIMWSMAHEITRAKRDIPFLHPDYVILYSGVNEEANAALAKLEGKDLTLGIAQGRPIFATNLDQDRWLKRNSVIIRLLDYSPTWLSSESSAKPNEPTVVQLETGDADALAKRHFLMVLGQFIDLIEQNGGTPIYVTMGGLRTLDGGIPRLLQYSRNGAELARQRGVLVLDAQDVVDAYPGDKRDLFIGSGVHWTKLGAKLLAQFIQAKAFPARTSGRSESFHPSVVYRVH